MDIESDDVVRVPPRGDDVLNTGKVGSSADLSISDEVVPAYPKNRTMASHVEGLELNKSYCNSDLGLCFRTVLKWFH